METITTEKNIPRLLRFDNLVKTMPIQDELSAMPYRHEIKSFLESQWKDREHRKLPKNDYRTVLGREYYEPNMSKTWYLTFSRMRLKEIGHYRAYINSVMDKGFKVTKRTKKTMSDMHEDFDQHSMAYLKLCMVESEHGRILDDVISFVKEKRQLQNWEMLYLFSDNGYGFTDNYENRQHEINSPEYIRRAEKYPDYFNWLQGRCDHDTLYLRFAWLNSLHHVHRSIENPHQIAYYPSYKHLKTGREVRVRIGKYLSNYKDFLGLTETVIKTAVDKWNTYMEQQTGWEVEIIGAKEKHAEKWWRVYKDDTNFSSCMTSREDAIKSYCHDDSPLGLAVAYNSDKEVIARSIVRNSPDDMKGYIRIYPSPDENKYGNYLRNWLKSNDYKNVTNLGGVRLLVEKDEYESRQWDEDVYYAPYIDNGNGGDDMKNAKLLFDDDTEKTYLELGCAYDDKDFYLNATSGRTHDFYDEREEDDERHCDCCDDYYEEHHVSWYEDVDQDLCEWCRNDNYDFCIKYLNGGEIETLAHNDDMVTVYGLTKDYPDEEQNVYYDEDTFEFYNVVFDNFRDEWVSLNNHFIDVVFVENRVETRREQRPNWNDKLKYHDVTAVERYALLHEMQGNWSNHKNVMDYGARFINVFDTYHAQHPNYPLSTRGNCYISKDGLVSLIFNDQHADLDYAFAEDVIELPDGDKIHRNSYHLVSGFNSLEYPDMINEREKGERE